MQQNAAPKTKKQKALFRFKTRTIEIQGTLQQNTIPIIKKQKILFRFKTRTVKIQGTLQQKANTCIAKLPGNKDFAVSNHALAE